LFYSFYFIQQKKEYILQRNILNKVRNNLKKILSVIGLIIGIIYILNPTFGVFEIIPDNIPYIGNLDEASAVLLILACLKELKKGRTKKNDSGSQIDDV
jgi:uncharacterized membrane protein YkvA (DUF1232 family)